MLTRFFVKHFLIIIFLYEGGPLFGQYVLDSVIIKGDKLYAFDLIESSYEKNDSNSIYFSTPDFLQNIIGGQLQMSSPGGLNTFLHRGMGARHLPLLWNGINIQSAMNGSFDYSLIPISLMDNISFYTLGSPTMTGNNSLAGAISIDKNRVLNKLQVTTSFSSLQNYMGSILTNFKSNKMTHKIGASYSIDKNIYSYKDGQALKKRTATDFKNLNFIYRNQWIVNHKNTLELDAWWQDASRNIPVSTTSAFVPQTQIDRNLRINLNHKYYSSGYKFSSSLSFMKENLDFITPSIDSRALVDVFQVDLELTELEKNDHYAFLKYRRDEASPNFYTENKNRETINMGVSKKIIIGKEIVSQFSIRQDLVDHVLMPTASSFLIIFKKTTLNIARNYNLPGLNDLYWPTGGNTKLKTEKIIQAELGNKFEWKSIFFSSKAYFNFINDWIQWVPSQNGIFAPINQKKVRSTGFELSADKIFNFKSFDLKTSLAYALNSTTAIEHYTSSEQIGKQLIFVPMHKTNIGASIVKERFETNIKYRLTGKRYDTPDHSQSLPVNHVVDIDLSYHFKAFTWQLNILNAFNEDYAIVRFFPLPRRHFVLLAKYSIK